MGFYKPLFAAALAALAGCGSSDYDRGRRYEARRQYHMAVRAYENFASGHPDDSRAAEAWVRAGDIYVRPFERCLEARRCYESAIRKFPGLEPWAARAEAGLLSCPDYFPLSGAYRWVYGDTASLGRNMRLEMAVESSSSTVGGTVHSLLYAGRKKIRSQTLVFERRDWAIWEMRGRENVPVLKYPFIPGRSWKAGNPSGELVYTIESDTAEVKTKAGRFRDCLKVKEVNRSIPGFWKYDYYAPGVGRVKTTIGGPGFENPNTELLKFDKMSD